MPATATKVVITHRRALLAKYGPGGYRRVRDALAKLVAADKARGLATRIVLLDDARSLHGAAGSGAVAVGDHLDAAATKAAVDAVATALDPSYVMLLGASDVVAQVPLANPLWTGDPADDADRVVPSDLPYACPAPYGTAVSAFIGPTRVVGRLADLVAAGDPVHLLALLDAATHWTPAPPEASPAAFGLTTRTWRGSTQQTLAALAVTPTLHVSPTEGPAWAAPEVAPLVHLVNCHGGELLPEWFGEAFAGQVNLPHAIESARLQGVRPGTVVAAECCYGTAHWDPAAAGGQPSVAAAYLRAGAVGVLGASTTAYGPADGTAYADLVVRYFLEAVLGGASLGRATLVARQRYVQGAGSLDPTDLKTVAQFELLGDPSVQPFAAPVAGPPGAKAARRPAGAAAGRAGAGAGAIGPGVDDRRRTLAAVGLALGGSVAAADQPARPISRARLAALSGLPIPAGATVRSFVAPVPTGAVAFLGGAAPAAARAPRRPATFHVAHLRDRARTLIVVREHPAAPAEVRVVRPR